MPELPSYFTDFLAEIRLSSNQISELKEAHTELRSRLSQDSDLSAIFIDTILQGSYRRSTIVQPPAGAKADVDVIVITRLDRNTTSPHEAQERFRAFLDQNYRGKWHPQCRSIGIDLV
jgi:tRNA nucleotidyltransferase (CCA-adding enzyme)